MATDEGLGLLRSIDTTLKHMLALMEARQPKAAATDRDLDGQYGNPQVKVMPRDWTGPSFKGRKYSECPAELLELVAEMQDYFARKAEESHETTSRGRPVAEFRKADAARARGWAKRVRDGHPATKATATEPATSPEWGAPSEFGSEGDDESAMPEAWR